RNIQQNGVVFSLSTDLDQSQGAMSIERSRGQHSKEVGLADVVGTRARHEDSAGAEHLEGTQVEFLVSADGRVEVPLRFSEGWRIENNGVVEALGGGIVLEEIEGVGLDPLDFPSAQDLLVQGGILVGNF